MKLLLRTPLIDVSEAGDLVRAVVQNRPEASPDDGALSAQTMAAFLRDEVLAPGSRYRGVILDVREAPEVFGPKTRDALELIFRAAEALGAPVVAVVSGTTQRLQFDSMLGIYAPRVGAVTADITSAEKLVLERRRMLG